MKKYFIKPIGLVISVLPMLAFAQGAVLNPRNNSIKSYNKLLQFLKGDGAFETWFMNAFTQLDTTMAAQSVGAVMLGQVIGGFGALCYLGYLGWQMQEGARPWEVTPMIRPVIISFILMFWGPFTSMIQAPLQLLAEPGISLFQDIEQDANDLRVLRFQKQQQLLDVLIKNKASEDAKNENLEKIEKKADDSWFDINMDQLLEPAKEWAMRMEFQIQKTLSEIVEAVSLTILRVCTYLIFFIQKIWSYVLIILGPIAVGMSLVPGFENSMNNWVAKFININLYTFITYTIINIGQQLIMTGYQMELDRYSLMVDSNGAVVDMATVQAYVENSGMLYTALFPCVAYIITGIGILMVPSIADSIVSAGGAGIMSKGKAAGGTVSSAGKAIGRTASAAAAGGVAGAVVAAKEIAKAVAKMNKK